MQKPSSYPPEYKSRYPGDLEIKVFRDPIRTFSRIARECGDVAYFKVGGKDMFVISNPEYIKEVIINHHQDFVKSDSLKIAKPLLGEGLLTSEGNFHHRQRRLVQPTFNHERVTGYAKVMVDRSLAASNSWKDGEVLDIHTEMMRLTLAIVAKTLFGADMEDKDAATVSDALSSALENLHKLKTPGSRVLRRLQISGDGQIQRSKETLDTIVYRIIEARQKSGDEDRGDLLSMLLQARDKEGDGTGMSDLQVRDEAMTLFLAGHETTAKALTWSWYLISENPEAESKLHAEIDSVLGGRPPTAHDFPKLEYTTRVMTEALRLYPPSWTLGVKVTKPFTVAGFLMPVGATLVMSQYLVHHDARYFAEPERFLPERWTPEFRSSLPRFAYFPFGGGPRACVGEQFAWMEGVLVMATIAQGWRLHHVKGHKVELLPRLTLRPKYGMNMTVTRRSGPSTKA
ncbi:MAG TPA: cytochrome P450 [Nitrososphaerales archaeon]|nr:cytochrome P450 [Nitrososphaerales archaeon]